MGFEPSTPEFGGYGTPCAIGCTKTTAENAFNMLSKCFTVCAWYVLFENVG